MGRRKSVGNTNNTDEETQQMDPTRRLKAQIAQCKGSLTRAENFLREQQAGAVDKDAVTIATRVHQVETVLETFNELTLQLHILLDQCGEEDFLEDSVEDRALSIIACLRKLMSSQPPSGSSKASFETAESSSYSNVKLPEIDIPLYDGKDVTKYQTFIELYTAVIDKNSRLEPIQKLFYLRKFLKGEPLSLIEGLPLTGDSYIKALDLLKNRYDNRFLVITTHIQALLDFQPTAKSAAGSLRELIAHARQHLAALKTLGQQTESWDMIILPILLRKVDQFSCRAYHAERDPSHLPRLEDFFTFIERRASSFEESQKSETVANRHIIFLEKFTVPGDNVPEEAGRSSLRES